jgi:hypothetical protein
LVCGTKENNPEDKSLSMVIWEPMMGAWNAYNLNDTFQGDNITIQAPILNEGVLYDLQVDICDIDNDTNRFKAINSITFDSRFECWRD